MALIKSAVRRVFGALGYDVIRRPAPGSRVEVEDALPEDFTSQDRELVNYVRPYTMTSPERIHALVEAARYIVRHKIPGDIVECGVWRGGSVMAVARVLLQLGDANRHLHLFDTFEGMTSPTEKDKRYDGTGADELFAAVKKEAPASNWCHSPIDEVRENLSRTGYDLDKVHFVKGLVESTIPAQAPACISLLRLDTDWYDSTRHELVHLFPRLSSGGVLILDDYGYWTGTRQATDEYLQEHGIRLLLNRIDLPGRIAVKP